MYVEVSQSLIAMRCVLHQVVLCSVSSHGSIPRPHRQGRAGDVEHSEVVGLAALGVELVQGEGSSLQDLLIALVCGGWAVRADGYNLGCRGWKRKREREGERERVGEREREGERE